MTHNFSRTLGLQNTITTLTGALFFNYRIKSAYVLIGMRDEK